MENKISMPLQNIHNELRQKVFQTQGRNKIISAVYSNGNKMQ